MAEAKHVTVKEFLDRRKENPQSVVIDVRDDEKWEEGHIPGAKHIHKTKIESEIESVLTDKNTEIFCHCGGGQSGARTAEALAKLGYKNAHVIDGGFRSYKASGEPIKK